MVNYLCVVVDSDSTTAQFGFLIAKHLKICHLQWNIVFVLLLSLTQQQHKLDYQSQNTWKYVFCNDKFHWFFCWFWPNNTINMNYQWKRPEIRPYLLENYFCVVVESDSTTAQYWLLIAWPLIYCCNSKLNVCCSIQISHAKAPNNTSSPMEDRLCVVVESASTTTQIEYSIAEHLEIPLLKCQFPLVLLLILTLE